MKFKTEVMEEEQKKKYTYFTNGWFRLKWNSETMLEFGKKVQSALDRRKDWRSMLSNDIQKRMKFIPQKTFTEISEIPYNETLEEFMTEFNKKVKLRLVPVQKTIAEATRIGFSGVSNAIPLGGKLILPKKRGRPRKE